MPSDEITIGPFRGVPIGQGGFATVYRVTDADGRLFALKLVDASADGDIRESLYHEFTVQSELIHPQVAHAHAFGIYDGRPYIVLDWIDGPELFEQFQSPTAEDFVRILRQFAHALLFIHHRGWVHGDLKPENFRWQSTNGGGASDSVAQLKLLDFGLARRVGDADRPRGAGTVGYCAPEFLNNLPADGRADWYAIGIILYEWIFGERPYCSDEPAAEIGGHLEGRADFDRARLRPAPPWADEVIQRLLAKTADERADDELALLAWLAQFDEELEPTALLNSQLRWHAQSESARLRDYENELLQLLHDEMAAGRAVHWSIASHSNPSAVCIARATALCSSTGYCTHLDRLNDGCVVLSDMSMSDRSDARIDIRFSPSLAQSMRDTVSPDRRSIVMLPWDREEVKSYVRGVVGDDDVAEAWVDVILGATCGLPGAVSELVRELIDGGALSVDPDGWGIREEAVDQWRDSRMPWHISRVFGPDTEVEKELCEWLALSEGYSARVVLTNLWAVSDTPYEEVLSMLSQRGLIACDENGHLGRFDVRLRLIGHARIIRSQMRSSAVETRSRRVADVVSATSLHPPELHALVLGHAWARSGVWDKSAEEFLRVASLAIAADERDRAMQFITLAQDSAQRVEDESTRRYWVGHARMVEGDLQKAGGHLDVARRIYRELLGLCRQTGDQRLLAETLHDLGDLYRIMRNHSKGIRVERRALQIWERLDDRAQASRSLNSLGNFHRLASEFPLAREFYQRALEIQRELGFERFAAVNLNNIGLICWQEYNFSDAEKYFSEALAIHERLNVPVEIARVLNNLGAISFVQGHLEESADFFTRAASLNAAAGAQSEELYNHRNLVEVAVERGDLRTAVSLGQQVYQASMELGDVSTLVEVGAVLADAYLRAGDYRSASRLREETLQRSTSIKNDELRVYLELQRAAAFFALNRPVEALEQLDLVAPMGIALPSRYLSIEAAILRVQIHVSLGRDREMLNQILSSALTEADTVRAPHKAAQLALAALPGVSDNSGREQLIARIEESLSQRRNWHWTATFRAWQARQFLETGELDQALAVITGTVEHLRRDGCWEKLWRSLVLLAEICHAQADYEPAMAALDEAGRMLKIVSSTVEDESERGSYLDCAEMRTLDRLRNRITELVS